MALRAMGLAGSPRGLRTVDMASRTQEPLCMGWAEEAKLRAATEGPVGEEENRKLKGRRVSGRRRW